MKYISGCLPVCVAAHRSLSACLFTCLCHPVCSLVWLCGSGTVRRVDAFYLCVNVGDDVDDSDNDVDGCDVGDVVMTVVVMRMAVMWVTVMGMVVVVMWMSGDDVDDHDDDVDDNDDDVDDHGDDVDDHDDDVDDNDMMWVTLMC